MKASRPDSKTLLPRELGYRMPAEWEPHRATWLAWPRNRDTWPRELELVKDLWAEMTRWISAAEEEVCLLVHDEKAQEEARERLGRFGASLERVSFYRIPTVDVWIRDYGPNFLLGKDGTLALNKWVFNAWGEKYEPYLEDDSVAWKIAGLRGGPVFEPKVVLEGGSIDVNGCGTCLTTEQCLLNPNRNPGLSRSAIEEILRDYLGVSHLVWLGAGIAGDDTDGHVDDIARFVNPTTVVCALEDNPRDENYRPLRENYERLAAARAENGAKLTVIPLPMPGKVVYEGARLPASYANFYIANGVVLVPTYGHPNDRLALGILGDLFPERKVIGIPSTSLVVGLGAVHCVTQQEPAARGSEIAEMKKIP